MPYSITTKDGITVEGIPDDVSPDDPRLKEKVLKIRAGPPIDSNPTSGNSFGQNALIGVGKAVSDTGLGLRQLASYVGIGDKAAIQKEVDDTKRLDAPLMNTVGGNVGNIGGQVGMALAPAGVLGIGAKVAASVPRAASSLPALLQTMPRSAVIADTLGAGAKALSVPQSVGGAVALGAAQGVAQPVASDESRLLNTGIGAAGGGVGKIAGDWLGKTLMARGAAQDAALAADKAKNATRDETLKMAQDAGFVVPPNQANPSLPNNLLEGFSGKIKTGQEAALKNEGQAVRTVKGDFGIPDNVPLTRDALQTVRAEASQAYEPVRNLGILDANQKYAQALDDIATTYDKGHGGMNSLRIPKVEQLLQDASKTQIDSANAIELLRNLREQGFANKSFTSSAQDKTLGKVQLGVADAIENLMDDGLQKAGQPEALQAFRDARRTIAKSFTLEKALNPATGALDNSYLAARFRAGKPLDGGMEVVGRTAAAFPKAMQKIDSSMGQKVGPLDYATAVMMSMHHPALAAGIFARPAVRAGILSTPYQKMMVNPPSYQRGMISKLLPQVADNDNTKALERLLLQGGLLNLPQ